MSIYTDLINVKIKGMKNIFGDETENKLLDRVKEVTELFDEFQKSAQINRGAVNSTEDNNRNKRNDMIVHDSTIEKELEDLANANKKFYTLLKDYDRVPMIAPQISMLLNYFATEVLAPDTRMRTRFKLNVTGSNVNNTSLINDIKEVRKEYKLDKILDSIVKKRLKRGAVFYRVIDYSETFKDILDNLKSNEIINESTTYGELLDIDRKSIYPSKEITIDNSKIINELASVYSNEYTELNNSKNINISGKTSLSIQFNSMGDTLNEMLVLLSDAYINNKAKPGNHSIINESIYIKNGEELILNETFNTSGGNLLNENDIDIKNKTRFSDEDRLNLERILSGKVNMYRCSVQEIDASRVFILKAGGHTLGYLYIAKELQNETPENLVLQKLYNSKSKADGTSLYEKAERKIVDNLATKIIKSIETEFKLNEIDNIDILHDFIINNNMVNKDNKIVFYRKDEIFNFSRTDGSLLTIPIYNITLYGSLRKNNITTKILKGRDRSIINIAAGASSIKPRYINNAIRSFTEPDNRLMGLTSNITSSLNPYNNGSDILLVSDDSSPQNIMSVDVIEGQKVDQDEETLNELLKTSMNGMNMDSAILEMLNGNVDFSRSWTMISKRLAMLAIDEQDDVIQEWIRFVICIMKICVEGFDNIINSGGVDIKLHEPTSLKLGLTQDELSSAVGYATNLADTIPLLNEEGNELLKMIYIYEKTKEYTTIEFETDEEILLKYIPLAVKHGLIVDKIKKNRENQPIEQDLDDVTAPDDLNDDEFDEDEDL